MKSPQIKCFVLLFAVSTFSFAVASKVTLNFYDVREKENYKPLLLSSDSNINVKCEQRLTKIYSGKLDIYSVSYEGFQTCNATEGKLLGTITCGLNHKNTKALNFVKKEGKTYYLIGFPRKKKKPHKRVLSDGSCQLFANLNTKFIVRFRKPADRTSRALKSPNLCEAAHCAGVPYSTCVIHRGKPLCKCIQSCTLDLVKVCGTDGIIYQNECELKTTACLTKKHISISKRQPCSDVTTNKPKSPCIQGCPKALNRVCGSDHVTYDNKCLLKKTACEKNKEIKVVKNGRCRATTNEAKPSCTQGCPKVIEQVCGSDSVTYDNKCLLEKTACEKNKEIMVVNNGICIDSAYFHTELCGSRVCPPYSECQSGDRCVCPKCSHDGKKVCGSDGMTYNDFCKLQKAACQRNTIIKMEKKGPCEACTGKICPPYAKCVNSDSGDKCECPDCSQKGGKVCGSDGRTYKHSCELKKHACKKNKRISVVSEGACVAPLRNAGTTKHSKEKKSTSSLKALYISIPIVGVLGIAIALAMCMFQPRKSRTTGNRRKVSSHQDKNSFKSLHNKYRAGDYSKENK